MPRDVATHHVRGVVSELTATPLSFTLRVRSDGSMVGVVAERGWTIADGLAAIDHFESTAAARVDSCRFTLTRTGEAQRFHCVARVSAKRGLAGRWTDAPDDEDDEVVVEWPFFMAVYTPPAEVAVGLKQKENKEQEQAQEPRVLFRTPTPSKGRRVETQAMTPRVRPRPAKDNTDLHGKGRVVRPRISMLRKLWKLDAETTTRYPMALRTVLFLASNMSFSGQVFPASLISLGFLSNAEIVGWDNTAGTRSAAQGSWKGDRITLKVDVQMSPSTTHSYFYEGTMSGKDERREVVGTWLCDKSSSREDSCINVVSGTFTWSETTENSPVVVEAGPEASHLR